MYILIIIIVVAAMTVFGFVAKTSKMNSIGQVPQVPMAAVNYHPITVKEAVRMASSMGKKISEDCVREAAKRGEFHAWKRKGVWWIDPFSFRDYILRLKKSK